MPDIGIRELKMRASEIVRSVREQRARYVITYRGSPVGLLTPIDETRPAASSASDSSAWDELARLGEEISRGWTSPRTSAELLSDMRR